MYEIPLFRYVLYDLFMKKTPSMLYVILVKESKAFRNKQKYERKVYNIFSCNNYVYCASIE